MGPLLALLALVAAGGCGQDGPARDRDARVPVTATAAASGGTTDPVSRYRFVGTPIALVGTTEPNGSTQVLVFARLNRALPRTGRGGIRGGFLLGGSSDLGGQFDAPPRWPRCYSQSFVDSAPRRLPEDGDPLPIALHLDGGRPVARIDAPARRATASELGNEGRQERFFRELGCRRRR